jgi:hypothetical protein
LEENDEDLKKLKRWFDKIQSLDFYDAPLARQARESLEKCEKLLEKFSDDVFSAQEENLVGKRESG